MARAAKPPRPQRASMPSERPTRPAPVVRPAAPQTAPRTAKQSGPSLLARLLLLAHRWSADRAGGRSEFVPTGGFRSLATETFDDPDRIHAYDYRATPRALVKWVLDELRPDYARTSFVDFGAGRGRVVLEAARRPFLRCLGVEISPALHEDAEQNLRHWPRSLMACREVDYIRDSILRVPLPEGPLLIWMFSPVTDRLMLRVAARLAECAATGRPITLVYVDPRHDMPFREAPVFRPHRIGDWRIRLLSPYRVQIWHLGS